MNLITKMKKNALFTESEAKIADFVISHPKETVNLTVQELAAQTYSAQSSIVRFCQKMGFKGFRDFKIHLASELNSFSMISERINVDLPFEKDAKNEEIMSIFLNLHRQTVMETYNGLHLASLEHVAEKIIKADVISLWGQGPSLVICEDFHYKLRRIGINSVLESQVGFHNPGKRKGLECEVAIIVSNYANSVQIASWIKGLIFNGTYVIMITSNAKSPLIHHVHHTVLVENDEPLTIKMGSFSSRIATMYALDVIYAIVFNMDYDRHYEIIERVNDRIHDQNKAFQTYIGDLENL